MNTAFAVPTTLPGDEHAAAPTPHVPEAAYAVRLARPEELDAVFALRYDVFYAEMGADDALSGMAGRDVDAYDALCDHLVVTAGEAIVGTYRLLPRRRLQGTGLPLYSAGEFDLAPLERVHGDGILELGRSCVHPDHRNGLIPRLLWAGIARYMLVHEVRALVGCVSVHGVSDVQALRLRDALRDRGHWHPGYDCAVKPGYAVGPSARTAYAKALTMVPSDPFRLVPPLMKGYFNLGAKACGGPAHDAPFHCHDFLVLLDADAISPKYYRALVQPLVDKRLVGDMTP